MASLISALIVLFTTNDPSTGFTADGVFEDHTKG